MLIFDHGDKYVLLHCGQIKHALFIESLTKMATCHEKTLLALACKHVSMCEFNFMEIMILEPVSLSESTTIFLFILGFQDYQGLILCH